MKSAYPFLMFCLILCIAGCKKHAYYSGTITSSADGLPLEGATVRLSFVTGTSHGPEGSDVEEMVTGKDGKYDLEVKARRADYGVFVVKKEGYVEVQREIIEPGERVNKDFVLHPYDAWLEATFENTSATQKRQYYGHFTGVFLYNDIRGLSSGVGPFDLMPGERKTFGTRIPGGAEIVFRWDTILPKYTLFRNTITKFCPRKDTTRFEIKL